MAMQYLIGYSTGGTLNLNLNTGTNTTVYMKYFWIINGTTSNSTRVWYVFDPAGSQWSITNFATDLRTYATSGMFGITPFALNILVFLIIFITVGLMSYQFGLTSPAAISVLVFALVAAFDVGLGMIDNPIGAVPYFPTIFFGLIMFGLLFKEMSD